MLGKSPIRLQSSFSFHLSHPFQAVCFSVSSISLYFCFPSFSFSLSLSLSSHTSLSSLSHPSLFPSHTITFSGINYRTQGEYILASAIHFYYQSIIFLDDDAITIPDVVAQLAHEASAFPNTILSTWALNFESYSDYWHRTMPPVHAETRYCGSAQMVAPTSLFVNVSALLTAYPDRFRSVSDLWFNAWAVIENGAYLRRSAAPVHETRAGDDYTAGTALSTRPGMRALKTEFMQYLSNSYHWPFVGDVGEYGVVAAAAQTSAARGALAVAIRQFELLTRCWPHYSKAWNNLGVALLRSADSMPFGDAGRRAVLVRARAALERAQALPDHRNMELVVRNLHLVDDLLKRV